MKKTFTLIALTAIASIATAQKTLPLPPNAGYETWNQSTQTGQLEPANYFTTEQIIYSLTPVPAPVTDDFVKRSTAKRSGSYAIEMVAINSANTGGETIPGAIILTEKLGDIFAGDLGAGYAYKYDRRPDSLKGFYKARQQGGDTVTIALIATKYDNVNKQRLFMGSGAFQTDIEQTTWKAFSAKINYDPDFDGEVPDSIVIVASSGNFEGQTTPGTSFSLDDLSLDTTKKTVAGINDVNTIKASLSVYPNPVQEEVRIKLSENIEGINEAIIYDAIGKRTIRKQLGAANYANNEWIIPVADLQVGMYIISLSNGKSMISRTFIKK